MPPPLALALALIFIGYLLRRDSREEPRVSAAVWIPTVWLMIIGSRPVSLWFDLGSAAPIEEGSPVDRLIYTLLIIAGVCVLAKRRVSVAAMVRNNPAFSLFLFYEGLSIVWSEFPFVAFKRWSKALGDPVMVMILWSEVDPIRAITAAMKRCAYILITLSVVFCKYYDNIGRAFDSWGQAFYTGVTTNKNLLGYLLFAFGLFFAARLISRLGHHAENGKRRRFDQGIDFLFLVMIGWLHLITNSKTALLAMFVGITIIVASRFATVRRHFGLWAAVAIVLFTLFEASFSLSDRVVTGAGRDETLTGRTGLWETLLKEPVNPVIGVGYASFWLGERLRRFWYMYPASPPTEAHNGYIEVYLNLGWIGLCLLAAMLLAGLRKMRIRMGSPSDPENSDQRMVRMFGLAYGIAYLFYNITEATFQGLNFLFVIFLTVGFDYPKAWESRAHQVSDVKARRHFQQRAVGQFVGRRSVDRGSAVALRKPSRRVTRETTWLP